MLDWLKPLEPPLVTEDDYTSGPPGRGACFYLSPAEPFNASRLRFGVAVQYLVGLWMTGAYGGSCHFDNVDGDTWTSCELESMLSVIQSGKIWRSDRIDKLIVEEIAPDVIDYFEVIRNEGKVSNIVNSLTGNGGTNGGHVFRGGIMK